jgi:hypothetical protein
MNHVTQVHCLNNELNEIIMYVKIRINNYKTRKTLETSLFPYAI